MLTLYHSSLSRSVRIVWLLEELGLAYDLRSLPLEPPTPRPFAQKTPTGKLPTLVDGDTTIFESGAILEYVLERYGEGRLAPPIGSPARGEFLQWVHFADSTAFTGLGNIAWHVRFKDDAERMADALDDYRGWALASLDLLERHLAERRYLLGDDFSGADVMVGYSVLVAKGFGVLADDHPAVNAYFARLTERPALKTALQA